MNTTDDMFKTLASPECIESELYAMAALVAANSEDRDQVLDGLQSTDFYRPIHARIFETVTKMSAEGKTVSAFTLRFALGGTDEDGVYLASLYAKRNALTINTDVTADMCDTVKLYALRRRAVVAALGIINDACDLYLSAEDILSKTQSHVTAIEGTAINREITQSTRQIGLEVFPEIEAMEAQGGGMTGVSTGHKELDVRTGGLDAGQLIIIAGRPAMGKTAFGMSIAEHVAIYRRKFVVVFSMEMERKQLYLRMLSSMSEVSSTVIRQGRYTAEQYEAIHSAGEILHNDFMHICDEPGMKPSRMLAEIRKIQRKGEIGCVVIDYLGLADPEHESNNRAQDVTALVRAFKKIARKVKTPVIVLSQLNRGVERRPDKRPMLSDLNESGGVEAEADIVIGLYRESYYARMAEASKWQPNEPQKDETEILILKHRNGDTGMFKVGFIPRFTKFTAWDGGTPEGGTGF